MDKLDIDRSTLELSGVDPADYPDFSDAYVERVCWKNGREFTEEEYEKYANQLDEIAQAEAFWTLVD